MIFQNLDNKRASESIGFLPSRVYAERKVGHRLLNKTRRKLNARLVNRKMLQILCVRGGSPRV